MISKLSFIASTISVFICTTFPSQATTLSFSIDNDGLLLMDREYTSGLFIRIADKPKAYGYSLEMASQIWTPRNISSPMVQPEQRPFAGLLYLQGRLHYQTSGLALKNSLMLGLVGSKSLGEDIQTFAHRIIHSPIPARWDQQIDDKTVYQLGLEVQHLLYRSDRNLFDFTFLTRGQIGNFQNEFALGSTFRLGQGLSDSFGSVSAVTNNTVDTDLLEHSPTGFFFYVTTEKRYRNRDITIDGDKPSIYNHLNVKKNQTAISTGVIYYKQHWGIAGSVNWQSQAYTGRQARAHSFANLTLFYRF